MGNTNIIGHQVVCSAFIEKKGKFLIIMCPKFKVWRVLGGRAEHGEVLEETLVREMQEEAGVVFKKPKLLGFGQDTQYHFPAEKETSRLIMYYHVKTEEELDLDPTEVDDFKWVTIQELKAIKNKEGALDDFFSRNSNIKIGT